MKTFLQITLALCFLLPGSASAAQTATERMYCRSVKFNRGYANFDLNSLELTTINASANGELLQLQAASPSHASTLLFYDETLFDDPMPGTLYLHVPTIPDSNQDGFNDFFDVSCGVNVTSQGTFTISGFASGTVEASWSRGAGSKDGRCDLNFKLSQFQSLGTFEHTFEILEYKGPLAYTPNKGSVTGLVSIVQSGAPENTLSGSLIFEKDKANPANWLDLLAGHLTNTSDQAMAFLAEPFDRDPEWPTNYFGNFSFADGDLSTSEIDYDSWVLSIDDLNDSDGDGIPDFSDTPAATPIRPPMLGLSVAGNTLSLRVSADIGTSWELQETSTLGAAWNTVSTVAVTTDPQTVPLALPPGNRFWRLLQQ